MPIDDSLRIVHKTSLLTALVLIGCYAPMATAKPVSFDDFPMLIHCEYKGLHHAYYLSKISPDGTATYITRDRMSGQISLTGTAKALGERDAGSCLDKTLAELRASGQTYELRK